MIRSAHSHTPQELQQIEKWHQKMDAAYRRVGENGEELGLKGQFGPDQLKMVAEKLLGRAISANLNGDVLRATIEFSLGYFKGNYSEDVYNRASSLYFDIQPLKQERNVLKKIYVYLDHFTPIKYLPLSVFSPVNQNKQKRAEIREREVVACVTHLSRLNFFNNPFTKDEQATVQRFKFKQALQRIMTLRGLCFQSLDEKFRGPNIGLLACGLANRLVKLNFKRVLVAALVLFATKGLGTLVNTTGYNTWRDPNDFANHNINTADPTDFCHYFIDYPRFAVLRDRLEPNFKKLMIDKLSDRFRTCQENPLSSRMHHMLNSAPGAVFAVSIALTSVILKKITRRHHRFFEIYQEFVLFTLKEKLVRSQQSDVKKPKKVVEVSETRKDDTEIDLLRKRHVWQIKSLLDGFIELRREAKTAMNEGRYSEAVLDVQRYREVAARLKAKTPRILNHLSWLEKGQLDKIKKALSDASK